MTDRYEKNHTKSAVSIKTFARYEPDTVYIGTGEYVAECVRADDGDYYLAADVDAEIEWLRTEIERLAMALWMAEEHINAITPEWYSAGQRVLAEIRAALRERLWEKA